MSLVLFRDRREAEEEEVADELLAGASLAGGAADDGVAVVTVVVAAIISSGPPSLMLPDADSRGVTTPSAAVNLLSSPPLADELALVLLLTVEDCAAVKGPSLMARSLDGVEARESLSFSPFPPFLEAAFLFFPVALACCLCTSFCRCTFTSLYFSTRFSGTHSSQLEERWRRVREMLPQPTAVLLTSYSIPRSG